MKFRTLLTVLFVCLSFSMTYASFPVKRTVKASTEMTTTDVAANDNIATITSPAATAYGQDKWVGVALWFFLGWPFAAHRWYYKKPVGWNILFILTFGGLGIWAIVDLINILTDNF